MKHSSKFSVIYHCVYKLLRNHLVYHPWHMLCTLQDLSASMLWQVGQWYHEARAFTVEAGQEKKMQG